jgi:hypothetical protein
LVLILTVSSIGFVCDGGKGKSATRAIDDWARQWSDDLQRNRRLPNEFNVPTPPAVELGTFADEVGRNVDESARQVSDYLGETYERAKSVFCYWFGWYVETGRTVPTQEEFPGLLLRYGFGLVLRSPPSKQFRDSIELFRDSIVRAQNEEEAAGNAATAAACSLPG